MNEIKKALYPNKTPSPLGSEERESDSPTPFEQRYVNYENFDPSHPFAPYSSTSHMGFDSQLGGDFGQQGPTFNAPPSPPHPEQPRPSMADEFITSIFGDLNPGMASSFHSSLIIVLCHNSLTHQCTPGQDHIGLHHMITPCWMINRRQGLKLLRTPFFSFLMIVDKGGEELD
jgi:hypothetical protein